jgi:hypothetical protein
MMKGTGSLMPPERSESAIAAELAGAVATKGLQHDDLVCVRGFVSQEAHSINLSRGLRANGQRHGQYKEGDDAEEKESRSQFVWRTETPQAYASF